MAELATFVVQGTLVALFAITLAQFAAERSRARLDVALMFGALSASSLLALIRVLTGRESLGPLAVAGTAVLLAQPYLLLRLSGHFDPLPRVPHRLSLGISAVAVAVLVAVPDPRPAAAILVIVVAFAIVEVYAAARFVRGALSRGGVTRRRLQLAAAGSGFLALLFLVAGFGASVPGVKPLADAAVPPIALLMGASYFFAFAPPRFLRRSWQLPELARFLQAVTEGGEPPTPEKTADRLLEAAGRAVNASRVAFVHRTRRGSTVVHVRRGEDLTAPDLDRESGIVGEAWRTGEPKASASAYAIPVAGTGRRMGVLDVALAAEPVFRADDLAMLTLLAKQAGTVLSNAEHVAELAEKTAALERSNADLEQFAYVASHDLQEPLRMVASYTQLLGQRYRGRLDPDADEFIGYAVEGATRMQRLIEDLLAFSRLTHADPAPTAIEASEACAAALRNLESAIASSGAKIVVDPLPVVVADGARLAQVFQNLIGNSVKFRSADRPCEIRVSAERGRGEWVFRVEDNGIGIAPAHRERIFLLFQRLHSASRYPGSGIGLTLVKRIVERGGGRVWVDSDSSEGTTFAFTVPDAP